MFQHLRLTRPLAVIDLETTGLDLQNDRIVEFAVLKYTPNTDHFSAVQRVNPGIPIPPAATAIHGIGDADVTGQPSFSEVAPQLLAFLNGCDLAGFGIKRFDLPFLRAEFCRAGRELPVDDRAIVDVKEIYHHRERRDLAAAARQFCGLEHVGVHAALADAAATAEVLDQMLGCYLDLPRSPADLDAAFRVPNAIDRDGRFVRDGEHIHFGFGKYRSRPLATVARSDPDYLRWMLRAGFSRDTTQIVCTALHQAQSNEVCQNQPRPSDAGPAFVPIRRSPIS